MGSHTGLKFLVYLFNLLLLLGGLALIVGGSIVQIHLNDYLSGFGMKFFIAPLLLIGAGIVMVFISAFGCFGTWKLLPWTLIVFAILLAAVFLVEIAGSVAAYMERSSMGEYIESHMNASIFGHGNGTKSPVVSDMSVWDRLQRQFHCCGVRGYGDWKRIGAGRIPDSCCNELNRSADGGCGQTSLSEGTIQHCDVPSDYNECPFFTQGCLTAAEQYVKQNSGTIGGIGFGIAAFQALGVLLAVCLAKKIRRDAPNL